MVVDAPPDAPRNVSSIPAPRAIPFSNPGRACAGAAFFGIIAIFTFFAATMIFLAFGKTLTLGLAVFPSAAVLALFVSVALDHVAYRSDKEERDLYENGNSVLACVTAKRPVSPGESSSVAEDISWEFSAEGVTYTGQLPSSLLPDCVVGDHIWVLYSSGRPQSSVPWSRFSVYHGEELV